MTHRKILDDAVKKLENAGIYEAKHDAWALFEASFNMSRTDYYMNDERDADARMNELYVERIERRAKHEPLQYILGSTCFMGLDFTVTPAVLIPRFDTEVLVDEALRIIPEGSKVLDMCTGSGCIAISIALLGKNNVTGVDISDDALHVAEINRVRLKATECVDFIKSDMFEAVNGTYDYILSNPPYIRSSDIDELADEVKNMEPRLALDGTEDGLFFYRILASESGRFLNKGGALIMEIGYDQAEDVSRLLEENKFADIRVIKDLAGFDRVVCGWRK